MTTHEHGPPEFVDDDEPVENVRAAFRRSEKAVTTKRPRDVNSLAAVIVAEATEPPEDATMWLVNVPAASTPGVIVRGLELSTPRDPYVKVENPGSLTVA